VFNDLKRSLESDGQISS
jgi:hypothetical protein